MPPSTPTPTYVLADLQAKVAIGHVQITRTAGETAGELGFDEEDIKECVLGLCGGHFYKTMASDTVKGAFQDVYKTEYCSRRVYIKLTLGAGSRPTVVVSFKRDTSAVEDLGERNHEEED